MHTITCVYTLVHVHVCTSTLAHTAHACVSSDPVMVEPWPELSLVCEADHAGRQLANSKSFQGKDFSLYSDHSQFSPRKELAVALGAP